MIRHVVFTPSGRRGPVAAGTTVLAAARELGVDLDSVCGGRGICGHCQVVPAAGSFAKWAIESGADALGAPGAAEINARPARPVQPGARLGCLAVVEQDVVIDVPASSQVHRPVVRKAIALDDLVVDPLVTLAYVELPAAAMDGTSLVTAIRAALLDQHGIDFGAVDASALAGLHRSFAGESRGGTVVLRRTGDPLPVLITSRPGFTDRAYGAAVDIGSTTIAGHLVDLTTGAVLASAGRMNPQIRFGEDLMSRVSYVMMNPGGDIELTHAVRDALGELLAELGATAGTAPTELFDIVLVGNPIMHHLLLGIDPTPLGSAPFELATDEAVHTTAAALGLAFPHAAVYVGPCIAGHVGADTAAATLAEGPYRSEHPQLLVDIGTNAEIMLGSTAAVWAASSPTGPAFEGAQISCGQRATAGAIERVRIDRETLEPSVKIIGSDEWTDDRAPSHTGPTVTGPTVTGPTVTGPT
ncbi:MAG: ASKHA domain-containing protein, partial [Acidimicrobiia bacterium]